MRILLINPFYPISETPSPPLGLAYIAAALEEAGHEVRVLDLVVAPCDDGLLRRLLEDFRPQMAGATAVTMTVAKAGAVLADVKRIDPRIVTVMGGPHVTFSARETLEACPELDVAVLGEGERSVVELARAVETGGRFERIDGIAFRENGMVRLTPPRGFISDLDGLPPPARRLLPLGRYLALGMPVSMTTSRGCPHQCIFCVGRKMVGSRVRYRSAERVVDELQQLAGLGFHQVNIADDLFTADRRHCSAVCAEILRRGLEVRWTSFARVDTVSEDLLTRMKAAGCSAVSFGVESANRAILKTVRKRITPEQVVSAVRLCTRVGVTPCASFILGLPGETPETLRETLEFGRRLRDMGLLYGFHLLAPFPGTEVRERSEALGLRILTDDWSLYHANRAVAETPGVSRRMLDDIALEWEDNFNRYLGDIKERMTRGEASDEEAGQVTNLERIVLVYDVMMSRLVETEGGWNTNGLDIDPLDVLASRIGKKMARSPAALKDSLAHAARKGCLVCTRNGGRTQWSWREYL
jgi:radical SAM superfamily enzyme YgiQ (UPF0313 family)